MSKDTQDSADQPGGTDPHPALRQSAQAAGDTPGPGDREGAGEQEQQPRDVGDIPDLGRFRDVTHQVTVNIGVLGNVHGGTVSAAGQSARSILGEAIARDSATHWQVGRDELYRLHQVFVPVASVVDRAKEILNSRHVLVLQGRMHWGKAATAQWLLTHLHQEKVFVIEPRDDRRLNDLTDTLHGDGYVIDTLSAEHAPQLRASTLLQLAEHLQAAEHRGHLVITVDALTSLPADLAAHLVVCLETPDASDVLWRHLEWELGTKDATEALNRAKGWVRERVQHVPPPGRVRDLAAALATMMREGGRLELAKRDYQQRVLAYVAEWFRQHPGRRERCFMSAAAVLNGAEYQDISNAADQLERLVCGEITDSGPIPSGWSRPFSPRLERVEDIGAKLRPGKGSGGGPLSVVELEEALVQAMVMAHLWYQHDDIFSHLFDWLDDLGRDSRFEVSGRAAGAASTLCVIDFAFLQRRLLVRWASDRTRTATRPDHTARISAAVALAAAAREPRLTAQVFDLLRQWSDRSAATGLPWTAATAFGLLDDPQFLSDALEGLRTITAYRWQMSWVVARSLANLCEARHAPQVLGTLVNWIDEPWRALAERALRVFERLMRVQADQGEDEPPLPLLLHLAARDDRVGNAVRQLWNDLAADTRPHVQKAALTALHHWCVLADDDERCHHAVGRVVRPLLLQHDTRQRTRRALRRCAFVLKPRSASARGILRATAIGLDNTADRIYAAWRFLVDQRGTA